MRHYFRRCASIGQSASLFLRSLKASDCYARSPRRLTPWPRDILCGPRSGPLFCDGLGIHESIEECPFHERPECSLTKAPKLVENWKVVSVDRVCPATFAECSFG